MWLGLNNRCKLTIVFWLRKKKTSIFFLSGFQFLDQKLNIERSFHYFLLLSHEMFEKASNEENHAVEKYKSQPIRTKENISSCRKSRLEGGRQKQVGPLWRVVKIIKSYPYLTETQIFVESLRCKRKFLQGFSSGVLRNIISSGRILEGGFLTCVPDSWIGFVRLASETHEIGQNPVYLHRCFGSGVGRRSVSSIWSWMALTQ